MATSSRKLYSELRSLDRHELRRVLIFVRGLLQARGDDLNDEVSEPTANVTYRLETVMAHLATDKKHAGGSLRWVLPGPSGPEVRSDVPDELVERVVGGLLAPAGAPSGSGSGRP